MGRVRPTLEYGVKAWGSAAKSNFSKTSKVQNQAARVITGAIKSTSIQELGTTTGLQSIETRRDTKILCQAAKYTRLPNHPMHERINKRNKKRLKRCSFTHQTILLEKEDAELKRDKSQSPFQSP